VRVKLGNIFQLLIVVCRRDPSLFDLSGVLHFLGPVLSYGGFGPGDASSGIIRRDGPLSVFFALSP
jgi:hypothetical protein